jgi:hypothetical protein
MEAATVLFAIAAAGGLTMAVMLMRGAEQPPAWLSMLHGFLATAGFTLLIEEAVTTGLPQLALLGLGALALAAAGGVYLNLGFRQKSRPLPFAVMGGHLALALLGFVLLLAAVIRENS